MSVQKRTALKNFINEVVKASPEYMKKEDLRGKLQEMVLSSLKNGDIADQSDLDDFFKTVKMATNALENVPFEVWKKLTSNK